MDQTNKESQRFAYKKENKSLLRKYFGLWRRKTKEKTNKLESAAVRLEQRDKLDKLVKSLKGHRREIHNFITSSSHETDSQENNCANFPSQKITTSYKNRYQAQKSALLKLSEQLEEKNKLIEELKLGIINNDALKSLENSRVDIHEIFSNCSVKVRCKVAPPSDFVDKFMVSSQKAPKLVQEMEEKALERAKRRELIKERKNQLERQRKRIIEEALENKRVQDELQKKESLELMKEQRRKELERQKIRQANKLIFLEKLNSAVNFHTNKLLKRSVQKLFLNYQRNKSNYRNSVIHYNQKILKITLSKWQQYVEDQYADKYQIAHFCYRRKTLGRALTTWRQICLNGVRSMQVAEDYYDFRLQSNTFIYWHRYVCTEYMRQLKFIKVAENHYSRRLLFQHFYLWRTLPAVLQLEKAKELKKRRWREKVWEILPNYKPPDYD